jgi:hypothetical protein
VGELCCFARRWACGQLVRQFATLIAFSLKACHCCFFLAAKGAVHLGKLHDSISFGAHARFLKVME